MPIAPTAGDPAADTRISGGGSSPPPERNLRSPRQKSPGAVWDCTNLSKGDLKMLLLLCAALLTATVCLAVKLRTLQRSLDEMGRDLEDLLHTDTNVLLSLSTRDPHARRLAAVLNRQLRLLRSERLRFQNGDRELRDAVTAISHDLRTPLTAICGCLDLLEREEKSDTVEHYLTLLRNRADAMTRLTEEMFRYSVILSTDNNLHLELTDMRAVLEESVAGLYAALTRQGIQPEIHLPTGPVVRRLDRASLGRIFGNILSNALKYSSGDLSIVLTPEGTASFTNTAPDLDQVEVERLFKRYYTVDNAHCSTGLGLSIARTLTELMGGTIRARFEKRNLTITVCFPPG